MFKNNQLFLLISDYILLKLIHYYSKIHKIFKLYTTYFYKTTTIVFIFREINYKTGIIKHNRCVYCMKKYYQVMLMITYHMWSK